MIVDSNGKEIKPLEEQVCPKCGAPPASRVPSGGFGEVYMICPCGYEFGGKLKCQPIVTS